MPFILLSAGQGEEGEEKKILVVEDDPSILRAIVSILKKNGFSPLQAFSGVEGLEAALEYHPYIIISDIRMPIMDGLTMLEKLREDEWGKYADVIIYTNYDDKDMVERAREQGVDDFYVKLDTSLAEIVSIVRSRL